ncbi:aldehyde ferredoxin oxidoreductase [candidate division KSB3 bacterium]|uniref:Aldehyde ferredoxin oxidoreductase n=1 Tax=candidate division KSB3 bacterium TaxID=2044937 RepID=A0A9D5JVU3_9BACT|nr:aldehyde ferredoxin oxidoreductase [candidate division KSB3 bacterium]MBD3324862.1 aldehyde ferredoxin oxidoreductase [candidate division KSB3 bacterium]
MYGYMGTILTVNLSSREIRREPLDEGFARRFLGGNGFAAKLIYDTVPLDADPFSEDNAVVFALGPFNGTPIWGSGRGHLASLSPLTGYFADSNYGGNFASVLKRTGIDALVVTGKADSPVYLLIDGDTVTIKDARDLWGKTTGETSAALVEKEGKGIETATIGPAGENGVLFANIICSGARHSAAGRGGMGAVLGSKQCKAIAVRGNQKVEVADAENLKAWLKEHLPAMRDNAKALSTYATPILVNMINSMGKLCTRNNTRETLEDANAISGELIKERYTQKDTACRGCPVACGKLVAVPEGVFGGQSVKIPEYETLYALGAMMENRDIVSLFNSNEMCEQMGMDTITMGVTLAFVAESLEQGFISVQDLGEAISFGPGGAQQPELIRLTALKQGVGELLALGSERLAARFGDASYKLLYSVKGMEIAGHSARGLRCMGLNYATATRGGSHHDGRPCYVEPDGDPGFDPQPEYCVNSQNYTALGDSLGMCRFIIERSFGNIWNDAAISDVINYVTGWDTTLEEVKAMGERIYNLERLINVTRGVNRSKDTLPYRAMHEPIPDGPVQGRYCPEETLQSMLDTYYALRGWDANGIPTKEKLAELELE